MTSDAATGAPAHRWSLAARHLYLCTPDRPDLEAFLHACIGGGVDIVQLRDKSLPDAKLLRRGEVARSVCAQHGVPFIVNDRPDLAVALGADGVHIGQQDTSPEDTRTMVGPDLLVGLSTHTGRELDAAAGSPVDYLSAGPVVPTPTKPGRPGTGLSYVRSAVARSPFPVWVTGGVDPSSVDRLAASGARHFVVVRYLTEAEDPADHAATLRRAIDEALERAARPGPIPVPDL